MSSLRIPEFHSGSINEHTYTIIRNLRGSWPQWCADLDDGRTVFIYIRYGEVRVGVGDSEQTASYAALEVRDGPEFAGVTDVLVALNVLRELGYRYMCPMHRDADKTREPSI